MSRTGPGGRFRELDGLRGIAALGVVVSHLTVSYDTRFAGQPVPFFQFRYGAFGVQLFFLISGFVILMTARRASRPSDFAISRLSRLYPVYWLALALSTMLGALWLPDHFGTSLRTFVVNLTMVQRWFLVDNVDAVYWTLAIEMQFYCAILLGLYLTRSRLTTSIIVRAIGAWVVLSVVVAIAAGPHSRGLDPQLVATPWKMLLNLSLAEFGPLFGTGCLAFLARHGDVSWRLPWVTGVVAIGVAALLHSATYALAVSIVVLAFLAVSRRRATALLRHPIVQWLGKVSYSLYVFHTVLSEGVVFSLTPYLGRDLAMLAGLVAVLCSAAVLNRVGEVWASAAMKQLLLTGRARWDQLSRGSTSGR